jgi:hypothetical protein
MIGGEKRLMANGECGPQFVFNQPVWIVIYFGNSRPMKSVSCPGVVTKVNKVKYGYTYTVTYVLNGQNKKAPEVSGERLSPR